MKDMLEIIEIAKSLQAELKENQQVCDKLKQIEQLAEVAIITDNVMEGVSYNFGTGW